MTILARGAAKFRSCCRDSTFLRSAMLHQSRAPAGHEGIVRRAQRACRSGLGSLPTSRQAPKLRPLRRPPRLLGRWRWRPRSRASSSLRRPPCVFQPRGFARPWRAAGRQRVGPRCPRGAWCPRGRASALGPRRRRRSCVRSSRTRGRRSRSAAPRLRGRTGRSCGRPPSPRHDRFSAQRVRTHARPAPCPRRGSPRGGEAARCRRRHLL
mmetsp:Transcript_22386/g.69455  ORF Transcript_22386/g.69455 Transcript_22386/m.69455 type:complete len:210 (-) Transcript_22386:1107-1736(-)